MSEDKYTRITLRIPKALHKQLSVMADETSKSLNAEIIGRLLTSVSDEAEQKRIQEGSVQFEYLGSEDAEVIEAEIIEQLSLLDQATSKIRLMIDKKEDIATSDKVATKKSNKINLDKL